MRTVVDGGPEGAPERDVDLLIEKGFLLLGSIEFQIDEHLMSHGTRIDPETRFFMAQIRDAAGDAAARLLDEARTRLEAVPVDSGREDRGADELAARSPAAALLPQPCEAVRPHLRGGVGRRGQPTLGRAAVRVGLGTAVAALCAALLLSWGEPDVAPMHVKARSAEKLVALETHPVSKPVDRRIWPPNQPLRPVTLRPAKARAIHADFRAAVAYPPDPIVRPEDTLRQLALATTALSGHRIFDSGYGSPYPDPRAGPEEARWAAAQPTAEATLALSHAGRLEVQRRLALADFDPLLFDGIFGSATRAALGAWQQAAGLPQTGYLNGPALALLRDQTDGDYRGWKSRRTRAARHEGRSAVLKSPLPPASPASHDECRRRPTGAILYGRGIRCDFRGLRENIAGLFG